MHWVLLSMQSYIYLSFVAAVLLVGVALLGFSRSIALSHLWFETVSKHRLQKVTSEDILRPWLVRIYQRARMYRLYSFFTLLVGLNAMAQIFLSTLVPNTPIWYVIVVTRALLMTFLIGMLIALLFSAPMGIYAELRALRRHFPDHDFSFSELKALYDVDCTFTVSACYDFDETSDNTSS